MILPDTNGNVYVYTISGTNCCKLRTNKLIVGCWGYPARECIDDERLSFCVGAGKFSFLFYLINSLVALVRGYFACLVQSCIFS